VITEMIDKLDDRWIGLEWMDVCIGSCLELTSDYV